jgi:hypothetical protein
LGNTEIESDHQKGREYFEGCTRFSMSLTEVLNQLTLRIRDMGEEQLYHANLSQMWGIFLLVIVILISPLLVVLARNAIFAIQVGPILTNSVSV